MFKITISPRFYETDANGHINNVAFAAWFETVRLSYLESLDEKSNLSNSVWLLASVSMDYVMEIFYGVDVEIEVVATKLRNSSLQLKCRMHRNGELIAKGSATVVYAGEDNKPCSIPNGLRRVIEREVMTIHQTHCKQGSSPNE